MGYDIWAEIGNSIITTDEDVKRKGKRSTDNTILFRQLLTWHSLGPLSNEKIVENRIDRYGNEKEVPLGKHKDLAKDRAKTEIAGKYCDDNDAFPYQVLCNSLLDSQGNMPWTNSFAVKIKWKLTTPWFSRADSEFDVFDNPISRDSLTGVPILKASGLKGMLSHACAMLDNPPQPEIARLCFGDANERDTEGSGGNVVFGTVIFDQVDVDLISPHDRKFGVVDHPVGFEVVPEGAGAETGFIIFPRSENDADKALSALCTLLKSFCLLLAVLGISAKRTIGYGMGEVEEITIYTGPGMVLGESGKIVKKAPYKEKAPEKHEFEKVALPDKGEALIHNGEICKETEAYGHYLKEFKVKEPLGKQRRVKQKLERKAIKWWEETNVYHEKMKSGDLKKQQEEEEAYVAWEKRKKAWEDKPENQSVYWEFGNFEAAIKAVESAIKEASE